MQAANYRSLTSAGNSLYYQRLGSRDTGPQFLVFDLGTKKETSLGSVNGYEISADGKKMLVSKDGKYGIIDLPKGPVSIGEALNLSGLEVEARPARRVAADLQRVLAADARLLLRPQPARRRLEGDP